MSYILDALRKAEQERHLGQTPSPVVPTTPSAVPMRPRSWVWLGVGLGVGLNIAVLAYLLMQQRQATTPAPATATTAPPPAPSSGTPTAMTAASLPSAATQLITTTSTTVPPSPPATAPSGMSATVSPLKPILHPTANAQRERQRKPTVKPPPVPAVTSTPRPAATPPGPSVTMAPEPPPLVSALPASARRRGAVALNLDIHVYSPSADKRFVVVGGQRYREGEQMADGTVLEAVTPSGATLRQGNRRFRLALPR